MVCFGVITAGFSGLGKILQRSGGSWPGNLPSDLACPRSVGSIKRQTLPACGAEIKKKKKLQTKTKNKIILLKLLYAHA